ncbi:MAG: DMT family transporter [Actinomycetota bacterium]|nr:DMT family transporter [Actinomycetota bacterium]
MTDTASGADRAGRSAPTAGDRRGFWLMVASAILFGGTFVPSQAALDDMNPVSVVAVRFWVAALVLVPLLVRDREQARAPVAGRFAGPLIAGTVNTVGFITISAALERTTASNTAFLSSLSVVVVPIVVLVATRTRPPKAVLAGVALAVAGSYVMTGATLHIGTGDGLALLDALIASGHILSVAYFAPRLASAWFNVGQLAVSAIVATPLLLLTGLGDVTGRALLLAALCGVAQAVALTFQIAGQRRLSPTSSVLVLLLVPVTGAVMGWWLTDDTLTGGDLLGGALIIASVLTVRLVPAGSRRRPVADPGDTIGSPG